MSRTSHRGRTGDDPLSVSEVRLRRAQRVARLGSWELDLATKVMWGSEEAFRIYGLPLSPDGSLPYEVVKQIPLPEHRPELDRALHELVSAGTPYELRFRIRRHGDGALRHVHSLAELTRDATGRPALITGTLQDVTEHEESVTALENALRANEERARLILEQAADAIFVGTPSGRFSLVNRHACELTGFPPEELVGRDFQLLFRPEVLAAAPLRFDLLDRGETAVSERVLTRKDGSEVLVEMRSKRLSDGTYQAIVRDISERRRLEEQLFLRQRMDSLGTLAAGIAHDFNNILAAIVGYADALRLSGRLGNEDDARRVAGILQAGHRGSDLIRGLQRLTHPEPQEPETFDLHAVAAEVFRVLGETTNRVIAKEMLIPPREFPVLGDASGLYHALMNLGINAVQAIEDKGTAPGDTVRIEARDHVATGDGSPALPAGRYVHVLVRDSGAGMPPEVRERAFDPLFTTKEKGQRKGQGLGLTVVYNVVVRQHRGLVEIESTEGRGSTFHLYLPRGSWADAARTPTEAVTLGGRETLLLIEDEHEIAEVFREFLERLGYTVLVAVDGQQGLDLFALRADAIDLTLLDLTLPKVSGAEVLRRISSLRPGARVVVSSGDAAVDRATLPGVARVLQKPYGLGVLAAAVREVLDEPAATPAPGTP